MLNLASPLKIYNLASLPSHLCLITISIFIACKFPQICYNGINNIINAYNKKSNISIYSHEKLYIARFHLPIKSQIHIDMRMVKEMKHMKEKWGFFPEICQKSIN